jgi:hypothetical protein
MGALQEPPVILREARGRSERFPGWNDFSKHCIKEYFFPFLDRLFSHLGPILKYQILLQ